MRTSISRTRLLLLVTALAVAGVVHARTGSPAVPASLRVAAVEPNGQVQFRQLNWLDDAGNPLVPFSRIAVAELSFSNGDAQLLLQNGGGYVNIVSDVGTGPRWSVENLYLAYPDLGYMLVSHPTMQFHAGVQDGTPVNAVAWSMAITAQPLASPPNGSPVFSQMGHADYLVGGIDNGGSGLRQIMEAIGPFVGCHALDCAQPDFIALLPIPAASIDPVNEGKMGCAPAAVARSLKYLFGSSALQGVDVQDIYAALSLLMGTNPVTGTNTDAIKSGKKKYAKQHGLDIQTNDHNFKNGVRFGSEGLENGADVEIQIKWPNGKGHLAMVTSIVSLGENKGYEIKYVDDPTQGDGTKANEEHTITVDKDGKIISGGSGKVEGFIIEKKKK